MMDKIKLNDIRTDYVKKKLSKEIVSEEPGEFFEKWLKEAIDAKVIEPTAMNISTVSGEGKPSSRIVLLKDFSDAKIYFYTNYNSRKGQELLSNPNCAINFFWPELERQVRIEGQAIKADEKISEDYFNSRPEESRISAIISPQSSIVKNREYLEELKENFIREGNKLTRPGNWGGFVVIPEYFEFWQGRPGRLHDRICYSKNGDNWEINRLAP